MTNRTRLQGGLADAIGSPTRPTGTDDRGTDAARELGAAPDDRAITMTLESTPRDATHWSTRTMAKATGMSQSAVSRLWRAFALQPHRVETFKLSKDLLFFDKVRHRRSVSRSTPSACWCGALMRRARFRRWIAAPRSCPCRSGCRSAARMTIAATARPHSLRRSTLTQKQIKRGAHRSTRELERAIREYVSITNEAPTPIIWTKTADQILASVARYCERIPDAGH